MNGQHHSTCGIIPPHILRRVAPATLEQMRELARARLHPLAAAAPALRAEAAAHARLAVYDAQRRTQLPGRLVMSGRHASVLDLEIAEAWNGAGATYDFYARVFGRDSIDGRGMRIDSTVHYSLRFDNAMWNGSEVVYGDGDRQYFNRFTCALDVIGHELTHGVTQSTAGLDYSGQSGALNEHISDAFGVMVRQYVHGQTVTQADWLVGAGLFTSRVHGVAIRSMAAPGTAYDDPIVGRDPQPSHMDGYVDTDDDDGGVHINSGIPNHAFYLAAMAIGGKSWEVTGKVWYAALTRHVGPDADFADFARATITAAGELYGSGGSVQRIVIRAWSEVGVLPTSTPAVPRVMAQYPVVAAVT